MPDGIGYGGEGAEDFLSQLLGVKVRGDRAGSDLDPTEDQAAAMQLARPTRGVTGPAIAPTGAPIFNVADDTSIASPASQPQRPRPGMKPGPLMETNERPKPGMKPGVQGAGLPRTPDPLDLINMAIDAISSRAPQRQASLARTRDRTGTAEDVGGSQASGIPNPIAYSADAASNFGNDVANVAKGYVDPVTPGEKGRNMLLELLRDSFLRQARTGGERPETTKAIPQFPQRTGPNDG